MRAEELPGRKSYQRRFGEAVESLIRAGGTRTADLHAIDIIGCYISAGVTLAMRSLPDYDIAGLLREIADDIDSRQHGQH